MKFMSVLLQTERPASPPPLTAGVAIIASVGPVCGQIMVQGRRKVGRLALIDRYLAKNITVPLLGTLLLAAMLLVLDKIVRLFDFVIDAGGPVSVVWRMLANLLPEYFALGIPIGLLLGILLAFRKLALSSELDALRGIGVGYGRLLRVPYMLRGRAAAAQHRHRRLGRALFALSLRRAALRPSLGRARRGDQGRRVQHAWASA